MFGYIANDVKGIRIIDISNVNSISELAYYDKSVEMRDIIFENNKCFILGEYGEIVNDRFIKW